MIQKLGIASLNEMQEEALKAISNQKEVVLTSPTGTGKTLAYLMPLLKALDHGYDGVQLLVIVPTRELGIQTASVIRSLGTGYKTEVVYGGRAISKDKIDLATTPSILIGTPGRLADHVRRESFDCDQIRFLVLDEFDKSLEIGYDDDMEEILQDLRYVEKKVLTSATSNIDFPAFVDLQRPHRIDYHDKGGAQLQIWKVLSPEKDKLATLKETLDHIGSGVGIIFCNYKDSINRISSFLSEAGISHGTYHGGMEQQDRERALIKFRNGTHQLLLSTDLAARGLDIPELSFIIHYHLPHHKHEFIHRNGRTARMTSSGSAYVIVWEGDTELPDFVTTIDPINLDNTSTWSAVQSQTLFISGGRKDKISKGDIAGLLIKQGKLAPADVGVIELKRDCAFVGIVTDHIDSVVGKVNNTKLKKKKVRVYEI